jgi:hypothetical protein
MIASGSISSQTGGQDQEEKSTPSTMTRKGRHGSWVPLSPPILMVIPSAAALCIELLHEALFVGRIFDKFVWT